MKELGPKEITPGLSKEFYTKSNNNVELVGTILNSDAGISVKGENITPADLFYIPENLDYEQRMDIIAKRLHIKREDLEKELPEISKCWQEAKRFLVEYLIPEGSHLRNLPKEIENIDEFKSLKDLEKTFSRTTRLKKGDSLGFSPYYCALATLVVTVKEFRSEEFEGLKNESAYVVSKLFQESKDGATHFHFTRPAEEEWSHVGIMLDDGSWMNAKLSFRGKSKNSILMKITSKPEISAKDIVIDGIGLRFEVKNPQEAKRLFLFLVKFFPNNFDTEQIIFVNSKLIDDNDVDFINALGENDIPFYRGKNTSSHKNFVSAKIRGGIKVPLNGEEKNIRLSRNFEIQVVPTDNKNETGLIQHPIYKRIQKLSVFSRLFGTFSEKFLDAMCQEASDITKISKDKIKKYIIERGLARVSSSKSKFTKYISFDQFSRWEKAGIVPSGFEINNADKKRLEKDQAKK